MYWSLHISYALTLCLAVAASAFQVRMFIIQHDCGHGSFFASRRANDILGAMCGVLTLAPYSHWRRQHAQHHVSWNNLDRRDTGVDIYSNCLTVAEYRALTPWRRFVYRLPRHPLLAHLAIPPLVFLLLYRMPFDTPKDWTRERRSVWTTNLAVLAMWSALALFFGLRAVLMVQLPIVILSTVVGIWLFSVQHRFEGAHWSRRDQWNFADASLRGSSYLRLPAVLHWVTGNIGFHHIHHLSPRVPNYRLAACHRSSALLQPKIPLTLARAFSAGRLVLWDEAQSKLVGFDAPGSGRNEGPELIWTV
jgi:omega-6 fatty acid desaturase (delta-12 desaturase)